LLRDKKKVVSVFVRFRAPLRERCLASVVDFDRFLYR
jgi:hypothetical protein